MLAAAPCMAAGPYSFEATQSVSRESNLLRAESGQVVPDGLSRSDTVYSTVVRGGIDQTIGRQRLFGDASLRRTQFQRNSVYDSAGYRLAGGLDWATVERLSGSLTWSAQRQLASFSNDEAGILARRNVERTRQVESALRWGVSARLAAEAALTWRDVDFSAPEFASRQFRQGSVYLGLRHELSGAAWWSMGLRQARGNYPQFRRAADGGFQADHFERQELDLRAALRPSGASDLEARLGLGRTRYDRATSRDVSGLFGTLAWNWRPSGRLRMRTQWSRDPSQDSYFLETNFGRGTLSYDRVATAFQLRADHSLTAKTSWYAAWGWTDRSLTRSIEVASVAVPSLRSEDRTYQYAIGLRWQPTRSLLVGLDVNAEERREGSLLSRPYRASSISTFGQLSLP
jgi:hypothetical protein